MDESLTLFRANSLFRNFEIYGAADRVLVYLILFISDCLTRISTHPNWTTSEAGKQLQSHAVDNFALPGEPGFPINQMYEKAGNRMDSGASAILDFSVMLMFVSATYRPDEAIPDAIETRVCS